MLDSLSLLASGLRPRIDSRLQERLRGLQRPPPVFSHLVQPTRGIVQTAEGRIHPTPDAVQFGLGAFRLPEHAEYTHEWLLYGIR